MNLYIYERLPSTYYTPPPHIHTQESYWEIYITIQIAYFHAPPSVDVCMLFIPTPVILKSIVLLDL